MLRRSKEERLWAAIEAARRPKQRKRLSNKDIRGIRLGAKEGITQTSLAQTYGTSQGYISDILSGRRRASVTPKFIPMTF